jgi:hypothetical protein
MLYFRVLNLNDINIHLKFKIHVILHDMKIHLKCDI